MRFFVLFILSLLLIQPFADAQVEAPNQEFIFDEDSERRKALEERKRERIRAANQGANDSNVDFQAPTVEYLQDEDVLRGSGGVVVSGNDLQLEAEQGQINLSTKDGSFAGDALLTMPGGVVEADEIDFNIDFETGEFRNSEFSLEEGAFLVEAERAKKLSDKKYEITNCLLSTCHCEDGSRPWKILSDTVNVTRDGYAHTYGSTINFQDVPFFYSPWLVVPVKEERASGLLVPQFGYSNRDGAALRQPIFGVIDDHSDFLFEPFIATRTRVGSAFEYRRSFSTRSNVQGRFIYSNEGPRDGELRGTNIDGIFDPEVDDNRFAGFYKQYWANEPSSSVPLSFVADINLVSDNLVLREMDEPELGANNSQFLRSDAILRASLGDYVSASLESEYNQALLIDQDLVFQRLPEARIDALRSFRPLGFHPLGLKLSTKTEFQATNFTRDEGYEGYRYDVRPSVRVPVRYKNFVNSEFEVGVRQTYYDMSSLLDPNPNTPEMLSDDSFDRSLFDGSFRVNTAVERVYELPQESWIKDLTALGSEAGQYELQRLKHTIEPSVRYQYVPEVDQSENPFFDGLDRFGRRSLVTYQLQTSLFGSFKPRGTLAPQQIEELAPEVEDFSQARDSQLLADLDNLYGTEEVFTAQNIRRGQNVIRELTRFRVYQSYDYFEDVDDRDPGREAVSDLGSDVTFFPTPQFAFRFENNFNVEEQDFSSYAISTHFRDDRGDVLRLRYNYVDDRVSQVEGNIQIALTDQLSVGYYTRYDELDNDVIEQRGALRLRSACDCWHMDFGVTEQLNPDRRRFLFSFTLRGLGDLTEEFGFREEEQNT